jgi:hypothetical protein
MLNSWLEAFPLSKKMVPFDITFLTYLAGSLPLETFLEKFCGFLFSSSSYSEEIYSVLQIVEDIPTSSLELFAKTIQNEREKRFGNPSDKKNKRREEYFMQENIIGFFAKAATKLSTQVYAESFFSKKAIKEHIRYWIHSPKVFSGFNVLVKINALSIVERFILLEGNKNLTIHLHKDPNSTVVTKKALLLLRYSPFYSTF